MSGVTRHRKAAHTRRVNKVKLPRVPLATDEQVNALLDTCDDYANDEHERRSVVDDCYAALAGDRAARARCAKILNERDAEILALRDQLEADFAVAQIATGYYASGAPVEPERARAARARCAAILRARAKR